MIPVSLVNRFGPLAAKLIVYATAALVVLAAIGIWHWRAELGIKTEAKLSKGQAGAAVASGSDAVATLGNRMQADATGDNTVMETRDAIDNATDAGGVTAAGRSGLCGLAGYRGKPECMHGDNPR